MHRFFTLLLFLSFLARPLYQAGYLAYFELNIDYIIEKYCVNKDKPKLECNGQCHLSQQLSIGQNQDFDKEPKTVSIYESFIPLYFQEIYTVDLLKIKNTKALQSVCVIKRCIKGYFTTPNPPPDFLS